MRKDMFIVITALPINFYIGSEFFDFNGWLSPCDKGFIDCISKLDNPRKIAEYMKNFICDDRFAESNVPYIIWKTKKANCAGFSNFGAFVSNFHGYKSSQLVVFYEGASEKFRISIYEEGPGMSFIAEQNYFDNHGKMFNSFEEITKCISVLYPESDYAKIKSYVISGHENGVIDRLWLNYDPEKYSNKKDKIKKGDD